MASGLTTARSSSTASSAGRLPCISAITAKVGNGLALANLDAIDAVAGLAVAVGVAHTEFVDHIHAAGHLAKDAMLTVEVGRRAKGDEELRAVGVAASVRHAEDARALVLARQRARLIGELISGAASASAGGVAALRHEGPDDAVKRSAIIEAIAGQRDKIVDGGRRLFRE